MTENNNTIFLRSLMTSIIFAILSCNGDRKEENINIHSQEIHKEQKNKPVSPPAEPISTQSNIKIRAFDNIYFGMSLDQVSSITKDQKMSIGDYSFRVGTMVAGGSGDYGLTRFDLISVDVVTKNSIDRILTVLKNVIPVNKYNGSKTTYFLEHGLEKFWVRSDFEKASNNSSLKPPFPEDYHNELGVYKWENDSTEITYGYYIDYNLKYLENLLEQGKFNENDIVKARGYKAIISFNSKFLGNLSDSSKARQEENILEKDRSKF